MDGLTHRLNKTSGIFESEQIGSFFSFAKEIDNGVVSLIGEARIPKRNPMLCDTLMRLYEAGTLNFSFEILVGNAIQKEGIMLIIELLKSLLYGIIEGITEWLPVSSTGHLILMGEFLPMDVSDNFSEMYDVVIQLGAILAVIVLFFHKLNRFVTGGNIYTCSRIAC